MNYKTVYVQKTFDAGVAVGSLKSFLAHANAGELVVTELDGVMQVELYIHNPLAVGWAEAQLAAFV
jgi:hypothetical protein